MDKKKREGLEEARQEEKLDELFSFEELDGGQGQALLREAKRKSYLHISAVSTGIVLLILFLVILLKMQLAPYLLHHEIIKIEDQYAVTGANMYVGPWDEHYKLWGSNASAVRYKLVEGVPVYEGELTAPGGGSYETISKEVSEDWLNNQYEPSYTLYGSKMMQFQWPRAKYEKSFMEFDRVKNLGDNEAAELGISFDQVYSINEAASMLPEGVTLAWCWVDNLGENMDAALVDGRALVQEAGEITGFSMADGSGKNGISYYEEITGEKIDENSKTLAGIVVTGKREALKKLENASFVRGASLGAVVKLY